MLELWTEFLYIVLDSKLRLNNCVFDCPFKSDWAVTMTTDVFTTMWCCYHCWQEFADTPSVWVELIKLKPFLFIIFFNFICSVCIKLDFRPPFFLNLFLCGHLEVVWYVSFMNMKLRTWKCALCVTVMCTGTARVTRKQQQASIMLTRLHINCHEQLM